MHLRVEEHCCKACDLFELAVKVYRFPPKYLSSCPVLCLTPQRNQGIVKLEGAVDLGRQKVWAPAPTLPLPSWVTLRKALGHLVLSFLTSGKLG